MNPLLKTAFQNLDRASIRYCVLRVPGDFGNESKSTEEYDVLLDPRDLEVFARMVGYAGFLSHPENHSGPHQPFMTYDPVADRWLSLDMLVALGYGPARLLRLGLMQDWLGRRRHTGSFYAAPPDARFFKLLLHAVLHRRDLPGAGADQMQELYREVLGDQSALANARRAAKEHLSPALPWAFIADCMETRSWSRLQSRRRALLWQMFAADLCGTTMRALKMLGQRLLRPFLSRHGYSVALLAPDGAGKSTLASLMCGIAAIRATSIYAGDGAASGSERAWLQHAAHDQTPGRGLGRICWRVCHYPARLALEWRRAWAVRRAMNSGRTVILDRCFYDRLLRPDASFFARLKRQVLHFWWRSPDLVILLDAPGEVLYARKREHSPDWLEAQRQLYRRLATSLPRTEIVDASSPLDDVRKHVTRLVWQRYATAANRPRNNGSLRHQHV